MRGHRGKAHLLEYRPERGRIGRREFDKLDSVHTYRIVPRRKGLIRHTQELGRPILRSLVVRGYSESIWANTSSAKWNAVFAAGTPQ